jgi:hypothetical protein
VQRERAAQSMQRGVGFTNLRVFVKGTEVRKGATGWSKTVLGSLVGASAGVMDVQAPTGGQLVSSVVIGNVPRVGTLFVAFADGTMHKSKLLQGSPRQMQAVVDEINRFNLMADMVTPKESS